MAVNLDGLRNWDRMLKDAQAQKDMIAHHTQAMQHTIEEDRAPVMSLTVTEIANGLLVNLSLGYGPSNTYYIESLSDLDGLISTKVAAEKINGASAQAHTPVAEQA